MSVIGDGGYSYFYTDKTSTACVRADALCGKGSTAVADTMGTIWGAGIGLNLNQMSGAMAYNVFAVPMSAKGISYGLSALPTQGARLQIDNGGSASTGGTDYCYALQAATGTVTWADFNSKCWDNSGTALSGPPQTATHIAVQVTAVSTATPFDFCVTSLSFM
jgi:hypothetical protein